MSVGTQVAHEPVVPTVVDAHGPVALVADKVVALTVGKQALHLAFGLYGQPSRGLLVGRKAINVAIVYGPEVALVVGCSKRQRMEWLC